MYKAMLLILVFWLFALSGCQRMVYRTDPQVGVYSGMRAGNIVRVLITKQTAHYLFWGLVPLKRPNLELLAKKNCRPNQYLTNITIKEANDFSDGFFAYITYGLYRPRTIEVIAQVSQGG